MTYAPYEMSDLSPDRRSPALRQEQRATFDRAMTRARDVQSRERVERWSPERSWGERLPGATRQWTSAADLALYLASEWRYFNGTEPTEQDRAKIDRTAQAMWTARLSERVAPPQTVDVDSENKWLREELAAADNRIAQLRAGLESGSRAAPSGDAA